jgi:hypothetical protein
LKLKKTFRDGNFLFIFFNNHKISSAIFKEINGDLKYIKKTEDIEDVKKWIFLVNLDKYNYKD